MRKFYSLFLLLLSIVFIVPLFVRGSDLEAFRMGVDWLFGKGAVAGGSDGTDEQPEIAGGVFGESAAEAETAARGVWSGGDAEYKPYELFIEKEYTYAKYEPDGCYLGAYILDDPYAPDISAFEKQSGAHAIYSCFIRLGGADKGLNTPTEGAFGEPQTAEAGILNDEYPFNFVLSCLAAGKTPLITLEPDYGALYDLDALRSFARSAGMINLPMFINLYPYSVQAGYASKKYKQFYSEAREIFAEFAPNAAIVWSIDYSALADASEFYPGDENVDWVGINIVLSRPEPDEGDYFDCAMENLEAFYLRFQEKKPLMITKMAVSHYSSRDNNYRTESAESELRAVYEKISGSYNRIKAVCYFDRSELGKAGGSDNYSLTSEEYILLSYRRLIKDGRFLKEVTKEGGGQASEIFLSAFAAYKKNDEFYIAAKSLTHDLGMSGVNILKGKIEISSEIMYPFDSVLRYRSFVVREDEENKRIVVVK